MICKVFWKSCGSLVDSIKIDDIQKCFDKPLDEAAKECGGKLILLFIVLILTM